MVMVSAYSELSCYDFILTDVNVKVPLQQTIFYELNDSLLAGFSVIMLTFYSPFVWHCANGNGAKRAKMGLQFVVSIKAALFF